jgi:hypothetical protein
MSGKRVTTLAIGLFIAIVSYFFVISGDSLVINNGWSYAINFILAIFFLAMLVSYQQYEEDLFSRIERFVSAFLFSFIVFFQLAYAPLATYFFKTLITKSFFLSDMLALFFLMLFLLLFIITFYTINSYARFGLLSNWRIFNNEKAFFLLRSLWLTGVMIAVCLYLRSPFIIIS